MKPFLRLLAAALLVASCAPAAPPTPARPALWTFADDDTTIYLFGTIHVLPDGIDWDRGKIERALASSDRLILEVNDPNGINGIQQAFQKLAASPNLPPIADRVAPQHRAALDAMIAKGGVPRAVLDRMETWAAALTLTATLYPQIGVTSEAGVETRLTERFEKAGKPIEGLETATEQLGYFDRLPEAAQRTFLESVVTEKDEAGAQFEQMIVAWRKGDVAALAITADDEARLSPELADALKRQRNANWAIRLQRELDRPGVLLVAVGAAHLAGKDSVQDMLARRGIRVKRLQ